MDGRRLTSAVLREISTGIQGRASWCRTPLHRCGRRAEFGSVFVFDNRETRLPHHLGRAKYVVIARTMAGIEQGRDGSKTPDARKSCALGDDGFIHQPFGQIGSSRIRPPYGIKQLPCDCGRA
jgi:hypothetical protein